MPKVTDESIKNLYRPSVKEEPSYDNERYVSELISITRLIYVLHALAPFTVWTSAILAIIIGYVKQNDARNIWVNTHLKYMSRVFWRGIFWLVPVCGPIAGYIFFWNNLDMVGASVRDLATLVIVVAWPYLLLIHIIVVFLFLPFFLLILSVWYLRCVFKGWILLNKRRAAA